MPSTEPTLVQSLLKYSFLYTPFSKVPAILYIFLYNFQFKLYSSCFLFLTFFRSLNLKTNSTGGGAIYTIAL